MRKSLLIAALALLPTTAVAQQTQPDALDGTNQTAGFGITPTGVVGSPTATIMTLSQSGAQINGGVQPVMQGAKAGGSCTNVGAISYDVTNDQIIYCSKNLVWTREGGGDSGTQCGVAVFNLDGYYNCGYITALEPCEGNQIITWHLVFGNTCMGINANCPSGYHYDQYSLDDDAYTGGGFVASCYKN